MIFQKNHFLFNNSKALCRTTCLIGPQTPHRIIRPVQPQVPQRRTRHENQRHIWQKLQKSASIIGRLLITLLSISTRGYYVSTLTWVSTHKKCGFTKTLQLNSLLGHMVINKHQLLSHLSKDITEISVNHQIVEWPELLRIRRTTNETLFTEHSFIIWEVT